MDIQNWGLGRIMQLPDCCFGRRWVVSCDVGGFGEVDLFDISEAALPESMVVWQLLMEARFTSAFLMYARIGLGDQLAGTEAEFMRFEPLLRGFGQQGAGPRRIYFYLYGASTSLFMRMPVQTGGRRLCLMGHGVSDAHIRVRVSIVVSGVPKEVPDWMLSGAVKSLL